MFQNIVFPNKPASTTVFNHWFLALHAFTHGFSTAQPLVPSPTCVQLFNRLFLPPHVFNDCIPTLLDTPHKST